MDFKIYGNIEAPTLLLIDRPEEVARRIIEALS